jgi:coenzyme F420-dependent glucose-6-phosphate dehydrogenase
LKKANLYTKPKTPIKIYVSAGGPRVAELAGKYADGLLIHPAKAGTLFKAFDNGARKADKDPSLLEKVAEVEVSYDEDYQAAVKSCRWWAGCMLPVFFRYDISDPREIEEHGKYVGDEAIANDPNLIVATTAEEHIQKIENIIRAGFNHLYFTSESPDEMKFIKFYGEKVLPYLRENYS